MLIVRDGPATFARCPHCNGDIPLTLTDARSTVVDHEEASPGLLMASWSIRREGHALLHHVPGT